MPSETDLRNRLRAAGGPPDGIDVDAVIRRARARRSPRVALASSAGALALAAVLTPAIILPTLQSDTAGPLSAQVPESESDSSGGTAADSIGIAPADRLNFCAAPPAEVAPAANGLVLEVEPLEADARVSSIPVEVTLRNTGTERVTGTTGGAPALTLVEDDVVLWHSNGPTTMIAVMVDLDPGESLVYETWFAPLVCGPEDDAAGFRPDLPAAGAGDYTLSAAIDFVPEDAEVGNRVLVSGEPAAVTLR